MTDFDTFWQAYPRRIAKGHARTAFDKAIRKTTLETMLLAIDAYKRFKPERTDFKHPATWLNGECWDDEWAPVPQELKQKRTFIDVARDRFNGRHGGNGNHADADRVPADNRPGRDDGSLRLGYESPVSGSHH